MYLQKEMDEIISNLKKDFSGSNDYLSGVNDGMYYLLRYLNGLEVKKSIEEGFKESESIRKLTDISPDTMKLEFK